MYMYIYIYIREEYKQTKNVFGNNIIQNVVTIQKDVNKELIGKNIIQNAVKMQKDLNKEFIWKQNHAECSHNTKGNK